MKRKLLFSTILVLISGLVFSFTFLKNKNLNNDLVKLESIKDTIQPKEDIKVNKKYDENGNLIQYDSTYTYSYSSNEKLSEEQIDSIFQSMSFGFFNSGNDPMMMQFPGMGNFTDVHKQIDQIRKQFGLPDMNESLFNNFFNSTPSKSPFDFNTNSPLEMFQLMDSLQNQYFQNQKDTNLQKDLYKKNNIKKTTNSSII